MSVNTSSEATTTDISTTLPADTPLTCSVDTPLTCSVDTPATCSVDTPATMPAGVPIVAAHNYQGRHPMLKEYNKKQKKPIITGIIKQKLHTINNKLNTTEQKKAAVRDMMQLLVGVIDYYETDYAFIDTIRAKFNEMIYECEMYDLVECYNLLFVDEKAAPAAPTSNDVSSISEFMHVPAANSKYDENEIRNMALDHYASHVLQFACKSHASDKYRRAFKVNDLIMAIDNVKGKWLPAVVEHVFYHQDITAYIVNFLGYDKSMKEVISNPAKIRPFATKAPYRFKRMQELE